MNFLTTIQIFAAFVLVQVMDTDGNIYEKRLQKSGYLGPENLTQGIEILEASDDGLHPYLLLNTHAALSPARLFYSNETEQVKPSTRSPDVMSSIKCRAERVPGPGRDSLVRVDGKLLSIPPGVDLNYICDKSLLWSLGTEPLYMNIAEDTGDTFWISGVRSCKGNHLEITLWDGADLYITYVTSVIDFLRHMQLIALNYKEILGKSVHYTNGGYYPAAGRGKRSLIEHVWDIAPEHTTILNQTYSHFMATVTSVPGEYLILHDDCSTTSTWTLKDSTYAPVNDVFIVAATELVNL